MGYVADQRSLLVTVITFLITAEIAVALRFWVRFKRHTQCRADDWCALAAGFVFMVQNCVECWAISQNYLGVDPTTMAIPQLTTSLKLVFAGVFLMSIILTLCRLSVLFLYNRLFGIYAGFRKILIVFGILSLMWPVTIWFGTTFRCKPIKGSWDLTIVSKCAFSIEDLFIGTEPINAVLDVALVILPISKIKLLQLPLKDRIALSFVFLLGGFVGLTSVLRLVFTYNPSKLGAVVDSVFWLQVQLGTAIICCCLPTLRSLLPSKQLFTPVSSSIRWLFGTRSRSTSSGHTFESVEKQQRKKSSYYENVPSTKSDDAIALTDVGGLARH